MSVVSILDRALDGERISDEDALTLLESRDLVAVGRASDELRNRKIDRRRVTFVIDRNLNYTNVCYTDCDFCAFYRRPGDQREGYLLPKPVIFKKIEETLALGGTALLMQGGHHPDLGVDYYEDLFSSIKSRYKIHLHALSPSEVQHAARRSKLTIPQTLTRLRDAGLDSLPGGGAEIFAERVRRRISHDKADADRYLAIHRLAHGLGIRSNVTMLYGHIETMEERVDHMLRVRALQDETDGFQAFIPLAFHPDNNQMRKLPAPSATDTLRVHAVARLLLDNVPHIKAFWIATGVEVAQIAQWYGANDLDGTVQEERIYHMAGSRTPEAMTPATIRRLIRAAGREPLERDTLYNVIEPEAVTPTAAAVRP